MNISIDESVLKKYNISLDEFLVLLLCSREVSIESIIESLLQKGLIDKNLRSDYTAVVSNNIKDLISAIIIDSDKRVIDKDAEFRAVAAKMRLLFPEGAKSGTNYMWRDSVGIVSKKLKTLVAKFDFHFTEEEALEATKRYVESFNGDYTYMQLLKYFILKTDRVTGDVRSDFMSLIENKDQQVNNSDNWLTEVR